MTSIISDWDNMARPDKMNGISGGEKNGTLKRN